MCVGRVLILSMMSLMHWMSHAVTVHEGEEEGDGMDDCFLCGECGCECVGEQGGGG